MSPTRRQFLTIGLTGAAGLLTTSVWGQGRGRRGAGRGPRPGRGPMRGRNDPTIEADHKVFEQLLTNRDKIRRTVKNLPNGVETLTETDDAELRGVLVEHVTAMYARVDEKRPIHLRDPLFAEVFAHADQIDMKFEETEKGVKVTETSDDPYVARLIQKHAEVVSLFLKNGHAEVRRNHSLPERNST